MNEKESQSATDKDIRGSNEVDPKRIAAYKEALRHAAEESDPLNVDGTPTLPNPNPDKPYVPPRLPTNKEREAARRGVAASREALEKGTDDLGEPPEAPDPRAQ